MSLGAPRKEKDKSGKECFATDVAVNSVWYDQTMVDSLTFTTFLVTLAMEGLCNKYGDLCNLDRQNWSILRNKRYMGKPQRHTIQQRANGSKIQEVAEKDNQKDLLTPLTSSKPLVTPVKEKPELLMVKYPNDAIDPQEIQATLKLPKIVTSDEVILELSPDRLALQSEVYVLDVFLPFNIIPDESKASFGLQKRELNIKMPVSKLMI